MRHRLLATIAATGTVAAIAAVPMTATATPPRPERRVQQDDRGRRRRRSAVLHARLARQAAGLATTLSKGSYTVFAPTNAAFAKVPKATLTALGKDKAKLKAILLYHVVKGRVPASKVVKLTSAKTLNGASVKIAVKGSSVFLNGSTKVTKTDVKASNGIIHVINKVLLPPA